MSISIVIVRGLLAEVERRGFGQDALLRLSNFDGARLFNLRDAVSLDAAELLVRNAIAITGEPGIGLTTAQHAPMNMLQVVTQLMLAQPTLRDAVAALIRYSDLLADQLAWSVQEIGELVMVSCTPALEGQAVRCLMDILLVTLMRVARHFVADGNPLVELHVQHAEPTYADHYAGIFECPVLFERAAYGLVLGRASMDVVQHHADATMCATSEELAESLLDEHGRAMSLAERVLAELRYESELQHLDAKKIARRFDLTVRALRRRLAAEGATLSALLDQARCRLACELLRGPDVCLKGISQQLGFSEPSAFHRAFKRWTEQTPLAYSRADSWTLSPAS